MYTCDQYFALLQYRSIFFFFKLFGALLSLHSFPTRRSSDLLDLEPVARVVEPADSLEQAARDVTLVVEGQLDGHRRPLGDRKSTRLNSSHVAISYAVFCLKKKIKN